MSRNFYIADMHFGHTNVLSFDNRPFKTIEEHDEALIHNWNSVVGENDTVYSLGDMFWKEGEKSVEILKNLKGKKILIQGNHDKLKNLAFARGFDDVMSYYEAKDGDKIVILFHYPIFSFNGQYRGNIHLYGHTHINFENNMIDHHKYLMEELYMKKCHMYNVGAMMPCINYTPRTLDEILYFHKE